MKRDHWVTTVEHSMAKSIAFYQLPLATNLAELKFPLSVMSLGDRVRT